MRVKKKKISSLKKKADKLFSEYIRKRDHNICFTCGTKTGRMQCGHFISRQYLIHRYDDLNNNCQCVRCNIFMKGNYIIYTLKMLDQFGREKIDRMIKTKSDISHYSIEDYEKIINDIKLKMELI